MAWRQPEPDGSFDPYKILVSEVMLQQTQVQRVTPKYHAFLSSFPSIRSLAAAELGEVLSAWSGLGYNRRAKFLWQAARHIVDGNNGVFPRTGDKLIKLPGIGRNTAGAILAYAYNQPQVFIETNIRTVLIHHFFQDQTSVTDKELEQLLVEILQQIRMPADDIPVFSPREFYWAMMDYGSFLKQTIGNLSRVSASYARQSTFEGSRRQIRGQVIRLLTERPYAYQELVTVLADERAAEIIAALEQEGLIKLNNNNVSLA